MSTIEQHLDDVSDLADALDAAEVSAREARAARDAAIRAALRAGVPYADLGEATRLTRDALQRIRRAGS